MPEHTHNDEVTLSSMVNLKMSSVFKEGDFIVRNGDINTRRKRCPPMVVWSSPSSMNRFIFTSGVARLLNPLATLLLMIGLSNTKGALAPFLGSVSSTVEYQHQVYKHC